MLFVYGLGTGLLVGGFLAYKFADSIIWKTVDAFKKFEALGVAEKNLISSKIEGFAADVKKDL